MAGTDGSIIIDTKILEDGFKKGIGSLGNLAKTGGIAIGAGIAAGTAALGAFYATSIKAAEADATADARILQISKSMGLFGDQTQVVADRLTTLATKQALATGVDDAAIKETQAKLLTFKDLASTADEVGGAFDRATAASVDLEAAGFGEASQNAVMLGKALQDPATGLAALSKTGALTKQQQKEIADAFNKTGDKAAAQASILEAIETQVGGTAAATANATDRMNVAWGEFQESAGAAFLPLLDALTPQLMALLSELTPSVEALGGALAAMLGGEVIDPSGLTDAVASIGTTLAGVIGSVLPGVVAAFAGLIVGVAQSLPSMLPPLMAALIQGLTVILQALPEILPALIDAVVMVMTMLAEALPTIMPLLLEAVIVLVTKLAEALGVLAPILIPAIIKTIVALAVVLVKQLPTIFKAAVTMFGGLLKGITTIWPTLINEIKTAVPKLAKWIVDEAPKWKQAGIDLVVGLWNGIKEKADWLGRKIKEFAAGVTDKLKDFFGIHSPSKLFEKEIGLNLALGIGSGFKKNIGSVASGMVRSVNGEMGRFTTAMPSITATGAAAGASSQQVINFNGRVKTYSEMLRATRDIKRGLVT